jgi:hypothetical protein
MAEVFSKSFEHPTTSSSSRRSARDRRARRLTVGELVSEPGWRWSEHVRPTVGGEWCQARHVGFILSGTIGIDFVDGSSARFGPGDVFDIPPGHDGYTVGDEPCVQVEWMGIRAWAGFPTGIHSRVLATLLFTDVVDSTSLAAELGDARWRELLSRLFEAIRGELERFGGREVDTTGDGMLVTFDGPARALHCAAALLRCAANNDVQIRVGVHVGEVELVGADVRGCGARGRPGDGGCRARRDHRLGVDEGPRRRYGPAFRDRGSRELKGSTASGSYSRSRRNDE